MKTCKYCGRKNADDAVGCYECGTNEFEGAIVVESEKIEMPDDGDAEQFCRPTDLPLPDARGFLALLEDEGVEFRLTPLDSRKREIDAFANNIGGSFGTAAAMRILTRAADDETVEKLWKRFCGFE